VPDGTVLYDGVCVLCLTWFRFVAARDPDIRFRFVQIQSPLGRDLAVRLGIEPDNPQTNAVVLNGRAYLRSDSAPQVLASPARMAVAGGSAPFAGLALYVEMRLLLGLGRLVHYRK
jgi:predicted DCC family thiol-disulfide oxidoreductase YuxK